jgi:hypothetical protein
MDSRMTTQESILENLIQSDYVYLEDLGLDAGIILE